MIVMWGMCRSAVDQCTTQTVTEAERRRAEDMAPTFEGKPGDLIEIFRGPYNHWAVYIGGNEVVHLTTDGGKSNESSINSKINTSSIDGKVSREKLSDVVGSNRYQVNNLHDNCRKPREPSIIVKKALEMVGPKQYNVATYNCEQFATEMRYGKAESRQIKNLIVGVAGGAVGMVAGAPFVAVGFLAVGAYRFLFCKRASS